MLASVASQAVDAIVYRKAGDQKSVLLHTYRAHRDQLEKEKDKKAALTTMVVPSPIASASVSSPLLSAVSPAGSSLADEEERAVAEIHKQVWRACCRQQSRLNVPMHSSRTVA